MGLLCNTGSIRRGSAKILQKSHPSYLNGVKQTSTGCAKPRLQAYTLDHTTCKRMQLPTLANRVLLTLHAGA